MRSSSADRPHRVLAVLVLYGRPLAAARPWPALRALLEAGDAGAGFVLERVVVHDNSPVADPEGPRIHARVEYRHDPTNAGTAGAYAPAARRGEALGLDWMWLLDHDTELPAGFLAAAGRALDRAPAAAALLPRVVAGGRAISPAALTRGGSIRPVAPDAPLRGAPWVTGISSGALVRLAAWRGLGPLPGHLWLDYVDHWVFLRLQLAGGTIEATDAVLDHDLSIEDPARLSARRLVSILDGESAFVRLLPWPARVLHPLRLLVRVLRYATVAPGRAVDLLAWAAGRRAHLRRADSAGPPALPR